MQELFEVLYRVCSSDNAPPPAERQVGRKETAQFEPSQSVSESHQSAITTNVVEGPNHCLPHVNVNSSATGFNFTGFYGLHNSGQKPTHEKKPSDSVEYEQDYGEQSFSRQYSNKLRVRHGKEAIKMVVQLMIEDIWSNFDNYQMQRKVVIQSQDLKRKSYQSVNLKVKESVESMKLGLTKTAQSPCKEEGDRQSPCFRIMKHSSSHKNLRP